MIIIALCCYEALWSIIMDKRLGCAGQRNNIYKNVCFVCYEIRKTIENAQVGLSYMYTILITHLFQHLLYGWQPILLMLYATQILLLQRLAFLQCLRVKIKCHVIMIVRYKNPPNTSVYSFCFLCSSLYSSDRSVKSFRHAAKLSHSILPQRAYESVTTLGILSINLLCICMGLDRPAKWIRYFGFSFLHLELKLWICKLVHL